MTEEEWRNKHQKLMKIVMERMKQDGFTITGASKYAPDIPETRIVKKWSPDVSGYNPKKGIKAYGEAKLCEYLYEKQSEKTGEQFVEFSNDKMENKGFFE